MTREEAINHIRDIIAENNSIKPSMAVFELEKEALRMAIKALEQNPCDDFVSRKAVEKIINKWLSHPDYELKDSIYDMTKKIHKLPSVTPKEKTGHWILADKQNKEDVVNDNFRFICSECLCSDIHAKNTIVPYCWKCGARMEVEE